MDTVHFAKILNTTGEVCGLDRGDYDREIAKRAAATKLPGESPQQGYTRIATQTPEGRELFKAAMKAPPMAPPRQAAQDLKPKTAGPASEELERLARDMARGKKLSMEQAYSRLITDPERKALLEEVKREEARQRAMVSDSRWPLHDAERQSKTREWVDELDAVGRRRMRPNAQ